MKANRYFICLESLMVHPVTGIVKQDSESLGDFVKRYSKIQFLCRTIFARPLPSLVEHPSVEFSYIRLGERIPSEKNTTAQGPPICCESFLAPTRSVLTSASNSALAVPIHPGLLAYSPEFG